NRNPAYAPVGAAVSIAVVAAVNYLGVKPGSRLLNVLVILKFVALAALIVGGLQFPFFQGPKVPRIDPPPPGGFAAFGSALVPILFAYGWRPRGQPVAREARPT